MILNKTERANLRKLSKSYNRDLNIIKISKHCTEFHELAKCRIAYYLKKNDLNFVTEAIFENGKRADIYCITTDIAYEVTHSEKPESIEKKKGSYPCYIKALDSMEILMQEHEDLDKYLS